MTGDDMDESENACAWLREEFSELKHQDMATDRANAALAAALLGLDKRQPPWFDLVGRTWRLALEPGLVGALGVTYLAWAAISAMGVAG